MGGPSAEYTEADDVDYHTTAIRNLSAVGTSTVAITILFGTIIFATTGLAARSWLAGDYRG